MYVRDLPVRLLNPFLFFARRGLRFGLFLLLKLEPASGLVSQVGVLTIFRLRITSSSSDDIVLEINIELEIDVDVELESDVADE